MANSRNLVMYGASPRASIALKASRVYAFIHGEDMVLPYPNMFTEWLIQSFGIESYLPMRRSPRASILTLSLIKYFIVSPYWNKPDEEENKAYLQRLIGNFFDGHFPAI